MGDGREHLELAVSLRALARCTSIPSARRALLDLAKRFDRMAAHYGSDVACGQSSIKQPMIAAQAPATTV
jgi:hypothetical protein